MKKFLIILGLICLCAAPAYAGEYYSTYVIDMESYGTIIDLVVDGRDISENSGISGVEYTAVVIDDITYVNLDDMARILAINHSYDAGNITMGNDDVVAMTTGEKTVTLNGEAVTDLPSAPIELEFQALVPLRYVAEIFGATVHYESGKVTVSNPIKNDAGIAKIERYFIYYPDKWVGADESMYISSVEPILETLDLSEATLLEIGDEDQTVDYYFHGYYRGLDVDGNEILKYKMYKLSANYTGTDKIAMKIYDVYNDQWYDGANNSNLFAGSVGSWHSIDNVNFTWE